MFADRMSILQVQAVKRVHRISSSVPRMMPHYAGREGECHLARQEGMLASYLRETVRHGQDTDTHYAISQVHDGAHIGISHPDPPAPDAASSSQVDLKS